MVKANCPRDKSVDVSICYLLREHLSVGITCRADNRVLAFISFGLSRFFTTPACILSPIYSTFVINSQPPRQVIPHTRIALLIIHYVRGETSGLAFRVPATMASRSVLTFSSGCGWLAVAPGESLPEAMRSMVAG